MVVTTTLIMLELVRDRPGGDGDPILTRGAIVVVVSWITRCGGAREPRACALMRMPGRLELKGGWYSMEKTIYLGLAEHPRGWYFALVPGGIGRQGQGANQRRLMDVGSRGSEVFDIVLQTKNILSNHDDISWDLRMNE